jgi:lipopolysaccharide export system protein LptA
MHHKVSRTSFQRTPQSRLSHGALALCFFCFTAIILPQASVLAEAGTQLNTAKNPFNSPDFNKSPTFINADSLQLSTQSRQFLYKGNVEVKHGDMTLTAELLEGTYNEQNKIQRLTARQNVVILKGSDIRATSNNANYEADKEVVTLTENPELTQNGSMLSADLIRLFLKEDRSEAQGQVRVKLVQKSSN